MKKLWVCQKHALNNLGKQLTLSLICLKHRLDHTEYVIEISFFYYCCFSILMELTSCWYTYEMVDSS